MGSTYSTRTVLSGVAGTIRTGLLWNGVRYLTLALAAPLP